MTHARHHDAASLYEPPTQTSSPHWLGALAPQTRIAGAVAFAGVAVASSGLAAMLAGLALAIGLAMACGLDRVITLRRVLTVEAFMAVAAVTLPFTVPGEPVATVFGLPVSFEGLVLSAELLLRVAAIMVVLLALVGTMPATRICDGLRRLRVPDRLASLMVLSVRFIGLIRDEYHRMSIAMRVRSFRPRADVHTWRSYGHLFGMLLVRAFERAERVHAAMRCRGFQGHFPGFAVQEWGRADGVFALCWGCLLVSMMVLGLLA